jgi:hypothetical protein
MGARGQGKSGHTRGGVRLGSRAGRRRFGARRPECGPRARVEDCSASGSGTPPIGRGGDGRSSPGSGPSEPPSDGPGMEPGPWKSNSRASATTGNPQTKPPHSTNKAACSPPRSPTWEPTMPTRSGRVTQTTSPANRIQKRERRRSDWFRATQTSIPSALVASLVFIFLNFPSFGGLRGEWIAD